MLISELVPPHTTSIVFGFITSSGTIGSFASPYLRLATAIVAMLIQGLSCLVAAFLISKLRETKGSTNVLKNSR